MNWLSLIGISVGLAMDAFAVSIVSGLTIKGLKKWQGIVIAAFFGVFQGLMPLIGYLLGSLFISYIEAYDHWVAFGLLLAIGGWMIFEGVKDIVRPEELKEKVFSWKKVIIQAIATSIDALAVGISLQTLGIFIVWDVLTIAIITFVICLFGVFLGTQISKLLKGKYSIANIIGGTILILIGVSILIEHLLGL
ncbi:MAG: manganese efflux pump MntP family protein [Bacilli bacterium]|nr:manganese efflux pump MntP family protein [Bacilli bacterium]